MSLGSNQPLLAKTKNFSFKPTQVNKRSQQLRPTIKPVPRRLSFQIGHNLSPDTKADHLQFGLMKKGQRQHHHILKPKMGSQQYNQIQHKIMGYIPVCTWLDKVKEIQNTFFFICSKQKCNTFTWIVVCFKLYSPLWIHKTTIPRHSGLTKLTPFNLPATILSFNKFFSFIMLVKCIILFFKVYNKPKQLRGWHLGSYNTSVQYLMAV